METSRPIERGFCGIRSDNPYLDLGSIERRVLRDLATHLPAFLFPCYLPIRRSLAFEPLRKKPAQVFLGNALYRRQKFLPADAAKSILLCNVVQRLAKSFRPHGAGKQIPY